jgi:hypothetical protein
MSLRSLCGTAEDRRVFEVSRTSLGLPILLSKARRSSASASRIA